MSSQHLVVDDSAFQLGDAEGLVIAVGDQDAAGPVEVALDMGRNVEVGHVGAVIDDDGRVREARDVGVERDGAVALEDVDGERGRGGRVGALDGREDGGAHRGGRAAGEAECDACLGVCGHDVAGDAAGQVADVDGGVAKVVGAGEAAERGGQVAEFVERDEGGEDHADGGLAEPGVAAVRGFACCFDVGHADALVA